MSVHFITIREECTHMASEVQFLHEKNLYTHTAHPNADHRRITKLGIDNRTEFRVVETFEERLTANGRKGVLS